MRMCEAASCWARRVVVAASVLSLTRHNAAATAELAISATRLTSVELSRVWPTGFSGVTSLRELSDGRLLVVDGPAQQLWITDLRGEPKAIGRVGRGPGEYESPESLYPIGRDSTLLVDLGRRRWLILHRDSVVATLPPDHAAIRLTGGYLLSADSTGQLLSVRYEPPRLGERVTTTRDSSELVLTALQGSRVQVVAKLRQRPMAISVRKMDETGQVTEGSTRTVGLLSAEESAVLASDGSVVIARLDPFRVDRRTRNGAWTPPVALGVLPIRVSERERRAYEERNGGGSRDAALYPRFIPPFTLGPRSLLAGPKGALLVRRTRSADFPNSHYWVVGKDNRIQGEITLASSERIALVTARWLYVVREDDDGASYVDRRALPTILQ